MPLTQVRWWVWCSREPPWRFETSETIWFQVRRPVTAINRQAKAPGTSITSTGRPTGSVLQVDPHHSWCTPQSAGPWVGVRIVSGLTGGSGERSQYSRSERGKPPWLTSAAKSASHQQEPACVTSPSAPACAPRPASSTPSRPATRLPPSPVPRRLRQLTRLPPGCHPQEQRRQKKSGLAAKLNKLEG